MASTDLPSPTPQPSAPAPAAAPRLLSSLKGPLIGGLCFVLALVLLWWNEARVDQTRLLQRARVVNAAVVDPDNDGQLVAVTGPVSVPQPLGDPLLLKPGDYVVLQRRVETFAWVEEREGDPARGETPVYRYGLRWTERPRPGPSFRYPEGHDNPPLLIHSERFTTPRAAVLSYHFAPIQARLPAPRPLPLTRSMLRVRPQDPSEAPVQAGTQSYLYRGAGDLLAPQLGDVRISYEALLARDLRSVTVFGWQADDELLPSRPAAGDNEEAKPVEPNGEVNAEPQGVDEDTLLRVIPGNLDHARSLLESEHRGTVWVLRAAGLALLWLGLNLMAHPLALLLLGRTPRRSWPLRALVLLPIAVLLALLTLAIVVITRSPPVLLAALAALFVAVRVVSRRARLRAQDTSQGR